MENPDLTEVKKVHVTYQADRVNQYLEAGWKLITTASGKDEMQYPVTSYTLGWFNEGAPVTPL